MAKPNSYFAYTKIGKAIKFINLSTSLNESPTFAWAFGDDTNSTDKDPAEKTYTNDGIYEVTLTVTNNIDEVDSLTLKLAIGDNSNDILTTSLIEYVDTFISSGLTEGIITKAEKISIIQQWQNFIYPMIEDPIIDSSNIYNETKWPLLGNKLVAQLTAYDMLIKIINMVIVASANTIITNDSDNQTNTIQQKKSIETGPAKVEWYSATETLDGVSKILSSYMKSGGMIDDMKNSICETAKRLKVYIPTICGDNNKVISFLISKNRRCDGYNANPLGVNQRML